jgi:hypothetical protein
MRLTGKQGENVKEVMTISPDFMSMGKNHTMCTAMVAGVTHTDATDKKSVDVILRFDEPIDVALLEVTVVKSNKPMSSNLWYYSAYDIVVVSSATSSSSSSSKSLKSNKSCKGVKSPKGSKSSKDKKSPKLRRA